MIYTHWKSTTTCSKRILYLL